MKRRVVITGLGLVTPLADGVIPSWDKLLKGHSGIRQIDTFRADDLPARIAGLVPHGAAEKPASGLFNSDHYIVPRDQKKIDRFIGSGIAAATQAVEDSGWMPQDEESRERTGVMIGSGIGGLNTIQDTTILLHESGPKRISPFFIPSCLINLASGHVSHQIRIQRPQSFCCDGLCHRRSCHWGCLSTH